MELRNTAQSVLMGTTSLAVLAAHGIYNGMSYLRIIQADQSLQLARGRSEGYAHEALPIEAIAHVGTASTLLY